MTTPLTIAVLSGGISHEREISLKTGRRVADALLSRGHRVDILEPDVDVFARLDDLSPNVVWPALHGSSGEDGSLLGLLEAHGVSWVGPSPGAARLAWSKPAAKVVFARAGLATPDSLTVTRDAFRELGATNVLSLITRSLGRHLVVKPAQGGSAQGVTVLDDPDSLPRALVDAFTYHDAAIIESHVTGTEVTATIVDTGDGPRALPLVEIVPTAGAYSFDARYTAGETTFFIPARLDESTRVATERAALSAFEALGLDFLARVDIIVDSAGTPQILEANAIPGLTETSSAPLAIEAAGFTAGELYEQLVLRALSI